MNNFNFHFYLNRQPAKLSNRTSINMESDTNGTRYKPKKKLHEPSTMEQIVTKQHNSCLPSERTVKKIVIILLLVSALCL